MLAETFDVSGIGGIVKTALEIGASGAHILFELISVMGGIGGIVKITLEIGAMGAVASAEIFTVGGIGGNIFCVILIVPMRCAFQLGETLISHTKVLYVASTIVKRY